MTIRAPAGLWARLLAIAGTLVLIAGAAGDPRWVDHPWALAIMTVATALFRMRSVSITKFATLSVVQVVAVTGALAAGAPTTALALYAGVLIADVVHHRKTFTASWINASREMVTLYAAYGVYAFVALRLTGGTSGTLAPDAIPAIAIFFLAHFVLNRAALYATLLTRNKLLPDEQSLILRYEVIVFIASMVASVAILAALAFVGKTGWIVIGVLLLFGAMLLRRILEEAVEAEELNRIHAMDMVVSADGSIEDSFRRIALLANRLVNWRDFRILRTEGNEQNPMVVFSAHEGMLEAPRAPDGDMSRVRRTVVDRRQTVVVNDTFRDDRVKGARPHARSVVVAPLRFGENLLGLLEIEHHKRQAYGEKQLVVIERFASQLSTTIQIQELRRPLAEALGRLESQLDRLGHSAHRLRGGADAVVGLVSDINRGIAEEAEEATLSRTAADELYRSTSAIARDAGEAAAASDRSALLATEHQSTVASAVDRLVTAKGIVADSSSLVGDLQKGAQRMTEFIRVIRDLADQTHLLALNAGIEAARAGEEGKGFAVVAEEIRRLAAQSGKVSEDASAILTGFAAQMERATRQMDRGQEMVADVEALSSSAMKALSSILHASDAAAAWSRRIAQVSHEQERFVAVTRDRAGKIDEISRRNREGSDLVSKSATEQAGALQELESATKELRELATHLADLTRRLTRIETA
jgi:methyl-accepting chemotaxis protein